ncbi:hypothetical protein [Saccharopolyspora antimicrobica]|uniref:Oxidoreductase n=1 Tax=Saccharopolyspora antimicrobica TaxID=455193 RepID=A0ABX9TBS6_9PSEU|nr:hypothetical protein [Saccharopolyspora antimicrobica]RKT84477.1 hypothetical protein ATL45_2793 [Saccharopolyspora antimicrobica]
MTASGEPALRASRVQVEQGIFGYKSTVEGGLVLNHARVGGPVTLNDSHLSGPSWALKANDLACAAHLGMQDVVARGAVHLLGARIGGSLVLLNTTLQNPGDWSLLLIDAEAGLVTLRPAADSAGSVSLRDARFKSITDDPPNWPENCRIELTGLTYQRLTRRSTDLAPCPIATRLEWMKRCSTTAGRRAFSPAPYTQLATALRADGMDREAREVQRFKERHRHRTLGPLGLLWGALQDATFGFGYRPALALAWVTALLCAGTAHFALAGPLRAIKKDEAPTWDPFLFSLDLLVPLVDLGHEKAWDPTGWNKAVALALIVGGWVLVTAVVAGAARVLTRNAP